MRFQVIRLSGYQGGAASDGRLRGGEIAAVVVADGTARAVAAAHASEDGRYYNFGSR